MQPLRLIKEKCFFFARGKRAWLIIYEWLFEKQVQLLTRKKNV